MDVVRGPESNAGCNAGAGTPYVILTSVWDPLRDHGRRAGPGNTCGMQCGPWAPYVIRDPDFSAGPTAGTWTSSGARNFMRDAMRGPGTRT